MIKIWLLAIRPKTLAASICPVCMGSVIALTNGCFDSLIFCLTLLTALGIQILCNLLNDYQDFLKGADSSARQGPIRVTAAGLVSVAGMRKASFLCALLTTLSAGYLIWIGGWTIALLLGISLGLAYCYTAGPFPLAYLGLGELFVLPFFGPIAVGSTYFLQAGHLHTDALIAGLAPGAISSAILIANNLRDETEDRAHHKKTLVVRFGNRFGTCEYLLFLLTALCLPLYFLNTHPFAIVACLAIIPTLFIFQTLFRGKDYQSLLPNTAKLLYFHTLLFCIGWML